MSSSKTKKVGLEAFMRELVKESLRDWFKEEDWVRISTAGNIVGPCGTSKNDKNPDRCLPRKKAESLTKAQRAATARKKKKAGSKGKTVVKNTKKAKVTEQETREYTIENIENPYKNSNLYSDPPQGKGRFAVLKRKHSNKTNMKNETSNPQDGKAAPYGSGYKKITKEDLLNLVAGTIYELKNQNTLEEDKDDRCTRIAKRKYETWPSAYASGAVVRCRRGEIWKDLKEDLSEAKATCCGRCGRVHIPKSQGGHGCKKPYLSKTSPKHCKNK